MTYSYPIFLKGQKVIAGASRGWSEGEAMVRITSPERNLLTLGSNTRKRKVT